MSLKKPGSRGPSRLLNGPAAPARLVSARRYPSQGENAKGAAGTAPYAPVPCLALCGRGNVGCPAAAFVARSSWDRSAFLAASQKTLVSFRGVEAQ